MFREPSYVESENQTVKPASKTPVSWGALHLLKPFLNYHLTTIFSALVFLILAAGSTLWLGAGLRKLVDSGLNLTTLPALLSSLFGIIAIMAISSFGRFYLVSWVGEQIIAALRHKLFHHLLSLSPSYFDTHPRSDIIDRVMTDTRLLQVMLGTSAGVGIRNMLMLIGGLCMMFYTSPLLSGVTLAIVPVVLVVIIIYGRYVGKLARITQGGFSSLQRLLDETISAFRTVLAFRREQSCHEHFAHVTKEHMDLARHHLRARGLMTAFVMCLVFIALCLVLWIGATIIHQGQLTQGELTAFLFYTILVAGTLGSYSEIMADFQNTLTVCDRLSTFLDTRSSLQLPTTPQSLPARITGSIRFENVTFTYPGRDIPALRNVSFTIAPGEKVAIVGPNGAGKSTIFQLLLRFYDIDAGNIFIDNVNIKNVMPEQLRAHMGWISQSPDLFSTTIYDNIAYGAPEASSLAVQQAAREAFVHDFIMELPQGYETHVGEKGVSLSGGQKQRLSFARVLMNRPEILLLDEPTSALDSLGETALQRTLNEAFSKHTHLTIAHRLATVLHADRILVLDQGEVVAEGPHKQLLKKSPLYQELYQNHIQKFDDTTNNPLPDIENPIQKKGH